MEPSSGAPRARGAPPTVQSARVAWTDAESARLLQLVEDFGSSDWSRIRDELSCSAWGRSRTLQECEKQWRKVKSAEEKQAREAVPKSLTPPSTPQSTVPTFSSEFFALPSEAQAVIDERLAKTFGARPQVKYWNKLGATIEEQFPGSKLPMKVGIQRWKELNTAKLAKKAARKQARIAEMGLEEGPDVVTKFRPRSTSVRHSANTSSSTSRQSNAQLAQQPVRESPFAASSAPPSPPSFSFATFFQSHPYPSDPHIYFNQHPSVQPWSPLGELLGPLEALDELESAAGKQRDVTVEEVLQALADVSR